MRAASQRCRGCDLYKTATQVVFGAGPRHARVVFIGEQPGDQEDRQGQPFVGPAGALFDKALEGAAKGSDGPKIVVAVKQLAVRMSFAKDGLGAKSTPDEIRAAASAIEAGVSVRDLARVRSAAGKRPVTMQLAVLTDLIARAVPIPTATDIVLQLTRSGVRDADLSLFQRNVRADIDNGADPTAAATTRARGLVAKSAPSGGKPGPSQ